MKNLTVRPRVLPDEALAQVRDRVSRATDPDRIGGDNTYLYIFWYDLKDEPRNAVERMIQNYLHPQVSGLIGDEPVGVEWWLGRLDPPYASTFVAGVHQDMGTRPGTEEVIHPVLSSILYLTTLDDGPLAVWPGEPLPQADGMEYLFPEENMFAMFPGDLWHAILTREDVLGVPLSPPATAARLSVAVNWWTLRPASDATAPKKLVAADYQGDVFPELMD